MWFKYYLFILLIRPNKPCLYLTCILRTYTNSIKPDTVPIFLISFLSSYMLICLYIYLYTYQYPYILIYQAPFAIRSTVDGTREVTAGHVIGGQPSGKVPGCFLAVSVYGMLASSGARKKGCNLGVITRI